MCLFTPRTQHCVDLRFSSSVDKDVNRIHSEGKTHLLTLNSYKSIQVKVTFLVLYLKNKGYLVTQILGNSLLYWDWNKVFTLIDWNWHISDSENHSLVHVFSMEESSKKYTLCNQQAVWRSILWSKWWYTKLVLWITCWKYIYFLKS